MADWANLNFQARLHAANEPGFLAVRHLELVALNGGHLGFCLNLGIDLVTPAGREAASFHAALIMFCWELCQQGIGHLPYHPAPWNMGPMGPIAAGPVNGPAGGPLGGQAEAAPPDDDFVEIIGGVDPVHGPWVVDHDFVEIVGGFDPVHGPWVEGQGEVAPNPEQQPIEDVGFLFGDDLGDELHLDMDFELDLNLL
jgi:hypothetical protein